MSKLISVIIPCYNVEKFIDRCMSSLINQTIGLHCLEVIVVNDASTDHTLDKLKEYENSYTEDILIVDLPENIKQGGARNIGLQYSTTDYIGFVDSDDWIEPTMYEHLYEKAIKYDCDLVSCKFKRVYEEGSPMGRTGKDDQLYFIETEQDRKRFIIDGLEGGIWCNLYKKSTILENELMFPERITYEDNLWLPVLLLYVNRVYILEEYLYHYFVNMQSTILSKNSFHHLDRLMIELMKLEEYKKREVLEKYYREFEYLFLKMYFINTLNILFTRFDRFPEGIFELMQEGVTKNFSDYENNPYLECMNNTELYFLSLVSIKLNLEQIEILGDKYRNETLFTN